MATKAIIKRNDMQVKVVYEGRMSYYVTVDNVAIECHPHLSGAVAAANRIAELGPEELKTRIEYAK